MDIVENYEGVLLYDHGSWKRHHTGVPARMANYIQLLDTLKNPDPDNLALAANGARIISAPKGSGSGWRAPDAIIDGVTGGLFESMDIKGKRIFHCMVTKPPEPAVFEIKLAETDRIDTVRIYQVEDENNKRMARQVTLFVAEPDGDYRKLGTYQLTACPVDGHKIQIPPTEAAKVKLAFADFANPSRLGIIEVEVFRVGD